MSRPKNRTPSYVLHKQTGRARATWTDALGVPRQKLLPGEFDSQESRTAFARLQLELPTTPLTTEPKKAKTALSVAELLLAYLEFAGRHYRSPDGTPTDEVRHVKTAC